GPQPGAQNCPGQRGGGVYMLDKDVRGIPGQLVPQDAAPHAGDHRHQHQQEQGGLGHRLIGDLDPHHREHPQAQGVHPKQQVVEQGGLVHKQPPHPSQKKDGGNGQSHQGAGGVLKGHGGDSPKIRSRITPPPTAVTSPRMHTPSRSIPFIRPVRAPEAAKATVPMRLTIQINGSMADTSRQCGFHDSAAPVYRILSQKARDTSRPGDYRPGSASPITSMLWRMWMAMACSAPSPSRFFRNSSSRAWSRRVSSASCSRCSPRSTAVETAWWMMGSSRSRNSLWADRTMAVWKAWSAWVRSRPARTERSTEIG